MTRRLKDIIDLDYLLNLDDAFYESKETLSACLHRDRRIYQQIKADHQTETGLVWAWFKIRREQYLKETNPSGTHVLPGSFFSAVYRRMVLFMMLLGGAAGFLTAGSFLIYHGSQPVNVALFFVLFVVIPMSLSLLSLAGLFIRAFGGNKNSKTPVLFVFQTFVKTVFFQMLPSIFNKIRKAGYGGMDDSVESTSKLPGSKLSGSDLSGSWLSGLTVRDYQHLFFWPFFILICLFAAMFSTGALASILFKVLVSDMAFGWQSTLVTSADAVHSILSAIAAPWSFFIPHGFAFPGIEQIQGSRIVLKQGISVLETPDLASWWPFLSMSIGVYALIPRVCLVGFGLLAQHRAVHQFEFTSPRFRQLIMRMTSPVVNIHTPDGEISHTGPSGEPVKQAKPADKTPGCQKGTIKNDNSTKTAWLLASNKIYSEAALSRVQKGIEHLYGVRVGHTCDMALNRIHENEALFKASMDDVDPVIVLYEAWQPPIRGVLYAIFQLRSMLPCSISLWILLTHSADQADLALAEDDVQFRVWQKAVQEMKDSKIIIKRLVSHE